MIFSEINYGEWKLQRETGFNFDRGCHHMIYLTDKAARKIKEILKNEQREDSALRLGIKGSGCGSSFQA